jgi:hypothetical protein
MLHGWQHRRRRWRRADEGLQDTYMKDIVNPGVVGKLQAVCHRTDPLQDLEWSGVLGAQLLAGARH